MRAEAPYYFPFYTAKHKREEKKLVRSLRVPEPDEA